MKRYDGTTDRQLVELVLSGDDAAFADIVERYYRYAYSIIVSYANDRELAEDLTQEVFVKILNHFRKSDVKHNVDGNLKNWICTLSKNLYLDHYRKMRRGIMIQSTDNDEEEYGYLENIGLCDESLEEKMVREQTHADMVALVRLLPDDQKETVLMRIYGNVTFRQIAEITEVSVNTALGRMRYALNNVRKMIKERERQLRQAAVLAA